ncbi:MAG TPA: hypothetical protein VD735_04435 [Candidatus Saccharimonadales bacterium]|nr:hypothetical protein [Candidatus Saccharimonadales bacterium]
MKVKLVSTSINDLPKRFRRYAYGQDEHNNLVDMVVGESYEVYGYREFDGESFYLVLNPDTLWWMPAKLYEPSAETIKPRLPRNWVRVEHREDANDSSEDPDVIIAPQAYHDNVKDIEDNTPKGQRASKAIQDAERGWE